MNNICEKCYFYTGSDCKFKKELNAKYEECDYFIDSNFVFEQAFNSAMEIKKIKNMMEKPDFQKKMDVFIEKSQDLKEQKTLEEHTKQLEENFNELFDGVNIFGRAKEEMIEALEDKNSELENENAELKAKAQENEKVLKIIKEKCLYNDNLNYVAVCINYDKYKEKMSEKYDTVVIKTDWDDKSLLDYLKLLTKEEFIILKRYCNGNNI